MKVNSEISLDWRLNLEVRFFLKSWILMTGIFKRNE